MAVIGRARTRFQRLRVGLKTNRQLALGELRQRLQHLNPRLVRQCPVHVLVQPVKAALLGVEAIPVAARFTDMGRQALM